ncbi:hypothetical protein [uncultured Jatrophihabitans sp.]|uniref:hypothetical protein n=1 Tax=uncultured Jatrophihabitans sp. TaxID=1610747 RepID=UPI0035C9DB58
MTAAETLHAEPEPGTAASPCCGRTLSQLPRYDRIILDPAQVTCGKLSAHEMTLLSGQPVVTDPNHQSTLFTLASTVAMLSGGRVPIVRALDSVSEALRDVLPAGRPLESWSAELMAQVTTKALVLAAR